MSEPRWKIHPPDAETRAMVEASRAEHPVGSCDLHRTPTGKCTCKCHCGKSVAIVSDPPMYEDLGPAARALCEDCLPLRCDAYPGACR